MIKKLINDVQKLCISLIYSNLVVTKSLNSNHRMHNLYANFVRILGVCKRFSQDLVNEKGNMPRCGVVPRFSDLEVIALSLTEETMGYDSESYLFGQLEDYRELMPNLISRRQYNDRRKYCVRRYASVLLRIWTEERRFSLLIPSPSRCASPQEATATRWARPVPRKHRTSDTAPRRLCNTSASSCIPSAEYQA